MALVAKADPYTDLYLDTAGDILFVGTRAEMLDHLRRTEHPLSGTSPEEHLAAADQDGSNMNDGHGWWGDHRGFSWDRDDRWLPRAKLAAFLFAYRVAGWDDASALLETHPDDRAATP